MKPVFIKSFVALMAAVITSFFVFALQGMYHAALATGMLAVLTLCIRGLMISPQRGSDPIWMPSRSQRRKMRRLKTARV